jgi:hypothetical protein
LKLHASEWAAVGIVARNGEIHGPDGETRTRLSYHLNQGIIITRGTVPPPSGEEDHESYD